MQNFRQDLKSKVDQFSWKLKRVRQVSNKLVLHFKILLADN